MHQEFIYLKPENSSELFALMDKYPDNAIIAGGTDLLVQIKNGKKKPSALIDIKSIDEFKGITLEKKQIFIGSLTKLNELAKNDLIAKYFPVFKEEVDLFACYELSNRATIGGNIAHSSPCADTSPILLVLEAIVLIVSPDGKREVPITEFFTGVGTNVMKKREVIKGFFIPIRNIKAIYKRADRVKGMDLASVNVAMSFETVKGEKLPRVRIGLGAVAPTPVRAKNTETFLLGKPLTDEVIQEATEIAMTDIKPISDTRGTEIYRREMVKVLIERSLKRLREV